MEEMLFGLWMKQLGEEENKTTYVEARNRIIENPILKKKVH
jgi:hypothetical protein